jgi:hypothetical protein
MKVLTKKMTHQWNKTEAIRLDRAVAVLHRISLKEIHGRVVNRWRRMSRAVKNQGPGRKVR